MNILLWYLPLTMFFGACDLVLAESETQRDTAWSAEWTSLGRMATTPRAPAERG
jgi:hypothetical protein